MMNNFFYSNLFEQIEQEKIYTPKAINNIIESILEKDQTIKGIWIEGEVYNFKKSDNGHIYFSLKEGDYTLECVYFNYFKTRQNLEFLRPIEIQNGKMILAFGDIKFYKKRGICQLNVKKIAESNRFGSIYEKLLKTFRKLKEEGLFDRQKKKLPYFCLNIGIATSRQGAAIHDIIKIARSRFPNVNLFLVPCFVQGEEAVASISQAIEILNSTKYPIDVIIAGRGGGSFDDLIPFSDEKVVQAFANSKIPIVSAVGHEINKPLCEYAADIVASTPSNAVELVVPEINKIIDDIKNLEIRIYNSIIQRINSNKEKLNLLFKRKIYESPISILEDYYQALDESCEKIKQRMQKIIEDKRHQLEIIKEKLLRLNPKEPLQRGYAIVLKKDSNEIIKDASSLKKEELIKIQFYKDSVIVKVLEQES